MKYQNGKVMGEAAVSYSKQQGVRSDTSKPKPKGETDYVKNLQAEINGFLAEGTIIEQR